MEKLYAQILYVINFITDPEFQWQQPWVRKVAEKCSIFSADAWTATRIPSGILIWLLAKRCKEFCLTTDYFIVTLAFALLVLLILVAVYLTDWIDGKVIAWLKETGKKTETSWYGSILDGGADRALILPLIFTWGWLEVKIIYLPLFGVLFIIEFFSYIVLGILERSGLIKNKENFYEHLKIGKYKFGMQGVLVFLLWVAYFFCPNWEWWPAIINTLLGIITIIAGFAFVCKINQSWIRFMADFFTLGNGICGLCAIFCARHNPRLAALLIIFGAAFDLMDGFIASKTKKGQSIWGGLMDSLADLITFGLAPAYLVWAITDSVIIPILYFVTTLTRLIVYLRQKKEKDKPKRSKFLGFPSTAAAIIMASVVFADFSASSLTLIMIACSFLEVAFMFEWYHFKNLFSLSIRAQIISIGSLFFFIAIGRGGEGMLGLLMAYALLFFRPVADRLFWKE